MHINPLPIPTPLPLNQRAMLMRLAISRPTTTKRDANAEAHIQAALDDKSLTVNTKLFRETSSPVRQLLHAVTAVYTYHKEHTLPYQDRGARLLPVDNYESYRDAMRKLIDEVDTQRRNVMPDYAQHVLNDMALRGARASINDYPTAEEFEAALSLKVIPSPLPDTSHFLFDVHPDDLAAMKDAASSAADAVRADLIARLKSPLLSLIDKLAIPAGEPGSIFRDTKVTNVAESAALVKTLAMGDPDIIKAADSIIAATSTIAANPHVLRESPEIRESSRAKLASVAKSMDFMFGPAES